MRAMLTVLGLVFASATLAGQSCKVRKPTPAEIAAASDTAYQILDSLEQSSARVAVIARAGTDLDKYGLKYSHAALVVRDHPAGLWTVVHMLNHCGTGDSGLFDQGLINFFVDDLYQLDAMVLHLTEEAQDEILDALESGLGSKIHEARYNMVAHPFSDRYQNSNQWLLELIAASAVASIAPSGEADRGFAQQVLRTTGYVADQIRVGRIKRIVGGLTQANVSFLHHPLGARIAGRYSVVTVRSIERYLDHHGLIVGRIEFSS